MGLLDDAIREHLDLKRRRGADPSEVARLEQEALGPVRRDRVPSEPAAQGEAPRSEEPAEGAPAAESAPAAAEHADDPRPASEDLHPDERTHVLAPEDRHEPPHGDPLFEHPAEATAEPADRQDSAPEPDSEQPERTAPPQQAVVDQPTTEYHVEDHHDDEHGAPEDVLEETPEFLQETPEHDRLWFEQRPPRDFDFDG